MFYKAKSLTDWYHGKARTESYRGTIIRKNDPDYVRLKVDIEERNKHRKRHLISNLDRGYYGEGEEMVKRLRKVFDYQGLERTKLCGRGRRRDTNGDPLYPNVDSHLRHADSTHFDVYVHRNHDAEEAFINWCKKEFAPDLYEAEQIEAEISRLEYKLLALKHGWQS